MNQTIRILILTFLLSSCYNGGDSFYSYYAEEDLYRMPVIKPYQLINLYGVEENEFPEWQLNFHYGGDKETSGFNSIGNPGYTPSAGATEINVANGIIYGHTPKQNDYPDVWFVVIPKEKIEKVFKAKETEWKNFLKDRGVTEIKLYHVWDLFKTYRDTYTLPWYNPKKNIFPE